MSPPSELEGHGFGLLILVTFRIPKAYKWASLYIPTQLGLFLTCHSAFQGPLLLKAIGAVSSHASAGYCDGRGECELRDALVQEMKVVYGNNVDINLEDVALTAGCNLAFVATVMSLAEAGDEVILPVPWCVDFNCSSVIFSSVSILQVFQPPVWTHWHSVSFLQSS
jgi:hypothetical protein